MNEDRENREAAASGEKKPKEPQKKTQKEIGGRDGPDPVRYGDWENKGIASDF